MVRKGGDRNDERLRKTGATQASGSRQRGTACLDAEIRLVMHLLSSPFPAMASV